MNERVKEWVLFNCSRRVTLKLQKPENGNVIPLNGKMCCVCACVRVCMCIRGSAIMTKLPIFIISVAKQEKRREKANFNDTISIKYCDAKCTTMRRKNRSETWWHPKKRRTEHCVCILSCLFVIHFDEQKDVAVVAATPAVAAL